MQLPLLCSACRSGSWCKGVHAAYAVALLKQFLQQSVVLKDMLLAGLLHDTDVDDCFN